MTYKEIIHQVQGQLHASISWWPVCFYHFTDIHNALGILDKGWIYGRNDAKKNQLMQSDNASESVISVTSDFVKDYGRLYFRPLTPTQYHNEGYKPKHIRDSGVNANCPVPIFFCLWAETILDTEGIEFVECGLAGQHHKKLQHGEEAYANLCFEKIYHNGPVNPESSDIKYYRHSEIVREGGIPIKGAISKIFCRSLAEKQTFLYLVQKQLPKKYLSCSLKVSYQPNLAMFFNNGIFIKTVARSETGLCIELNDPSKRYKAERANENGKDLRMSVTLYWLDSDSATILQKEELDIFLNYKVNGKVYVHLRTRYSKRVLVEINFDGCLMFENEIELSEQELV